MKKYIVLIFCIISGFAGAMPVEGSFAYESMVEYREESRDLLYGRKGIVNIPSAILREKRFLAGSEPVLEKIKQLEFGVEESEFPPEKLIDFGINELIVAIDSNLIHIDENGESVAFTLKDKLDVVAEIAIAYNSLCDEVHSYSDKVRRLVPFWKRFEVLLSEYIESKK